MAAPDEHRSQRVHRRPSLVLIGFMGTGKSCIGRRCARRLGFGFRDSDLLVEQRAGKPIASIFADDGEPAFRMAEAAAIRDLARTPRIVLATGGGAPMSAANVACLRAAGVVVLLEVSAEELARRVGDRQSRPLLAAADDPVARIEALLAERRPHYRAAAHVVVATTGLDHDQATEQVLAAYRRQAPRWLPAGAERSVR